MTRAIQTPEAPTAEFPVRVSHHVFEQLCQENPELRLERTSEGVLEVMSPASSDSGRRNAELTAMLVIWARADKRGVAFDSSAGFTLPNGAVRSPDASWIPLGRWNELGPEHKATGFAPICPEFVVELRSPTDGLRRMQDKMREYISQGARLGWLIDPTTRTVTVYRSGRRAETIVEPITLSGEDVLPGFVLDLKGILFD